MTKPLRAGAFVKKHNDVICVYLETTARWETPRHPNPKTRLERGFGVLTADDGYEALRILSEKRPIDVLFAAHDALVFCDQNGERACHARLTPRQFFC